MIQEIDNTILIQLQKGKFRKEIRLLSKPFDYKEFLLIKIFLKLVRVLSGEDMKKLFIGIIFLFYFKKFFKRSRPFVDNKNLTNRSKSKLDKHSFPSGHSFMSFLFASILYKKYKNRLLFLIPLLVGYSRIYLTVHYPSDVLFGFIFCFIYECIYDTTLFN